MAIRLEDHVDEDHRAMLELLLGDVSSLDIFLDEDIAYARALLRAEVPCELHVYPGAFHGSNYFVSHSDISQRWHRDEMAALDRALNGSAG